MYITIGTLLLLTYVGGSFCQGSLKSTALITSHNRPLLLRHLQSGTHPTGTRSRPMKPIQSSASIYYPQGVAGQSYPSSNCNPGDPYCSFAESATKYPLPECYTDSSGFLCCNRDMEALMRQAYYDLASQPNFQPCNIQLMANHLQKRLQTQFNSSFETVAGLGDFASKSHFYSNYICKIEVGGRYLMAYGTPRSSSPIFVPL